MRFEIGNKTLIGNELMHEYMSFHNGKLEGNLSSEFTKLIRECGRLVEHYASDILYDLRKIRNEMDAGLIPETAWFGFRECGVDGKSFIEHRIEERGMYRAIYVLDFQNASPDEWYQVKATLYRVR